MTWPEAVLGCVIAICVVLYMGVCTTGKWPWKKD
jgi:hypothetical protein